MASDSTAVVHNLEKPSRWNEFGVPVAIMSCLFQPNIIAPMHDGERLVHCQSEVRRSSVRQRRNEEDSKDCGEQELEKPKWRAGSAGRMRSPDGQHNLNLELDPNSS